MISVRTVELQAAVMSLPRLRGEYLTRRRLARTLGQRVIVRVLTDELVDRAGAS